MSSLKDQLDSETKDTNSGRDLYYKFQEGDNRLRILSEGSVIAKHFFGKGQIPSICYGISKGCPFHKVDDKPASVKYSCYILDRVDNQIKLADLPYSVTKKVSDLQEDQEWAFSSFPIPYDIKVVYKPNESAANMYSVVASPKREELPQEIMGKLAELLVSSDPSKLVQEQKDKQLQKHKEEGSWKGFDTDLTDEQKESIREAREAEIKSRETVNEDNISPEDIPF